MNAPIEDQLRDYFTMVDRMQGPVDTTSQTPDTPTLSLVDNDDRQAGDADINVMEDIMLSPDRNEPRNRSRAWMAVAASVAALALVGGLIVAANRDSDDEVPADQPTVTIPDTTGVDGETAPAPDAEQTVEQDPVPEASVAVDPDTVEPEADPEPDAADPIDEPVGEAVPPVERASAGSAEATCAFGPPTPGDRGTRTLLDQTCTFDEPGSLPFEAPQDIELAVLDTRTVQAVDAAPFTSIADSGMLTAGYSYGGGLARFVGVARGAGDYNGQRITITGLGQGNVAATYDWTTDRTFATPPGASDAVSEVSIECELTNFQFDDEDEARTFDQACTFSGDDPSFVPGPLSGPFRQFDSDPNGNGVDTNGFTYFTAELGDDVLFSGLVSVQGNVRFVSVWPGTGDLEGTLIHGVARVEVTREPTDDDPDRVIGTGVIFVTALPRSL